MTSSRIPQIAEQGRFVRFKRRTPIAVLLLVVSLTAATAEAWPWHHRRGEKAEVRFLASSNFIRGTWGWNQDTYLAEIYRPVTNETTLVRLIDSYPNTFPPISRAILTADTGTLMAVERDAECDLPFGQIQLRTAPGDPMAILPIPLSYQPRIEQTPRPKTNLPCYRVVRR